MTLHTRKRWTASAWRWTAALLLLLAACTLAGCGGNAHAGEVKPEVGYLAPEVELHDLNGQMIKLSDYRGKVVVLNFWATWCGPCRIELPTLKALWQRQADGLVVVGVDAGETPMDVVSFVMSNGIMYPVLLDQSMTTTRAYEVQTIPLTFVIDRDGVIRYRRRGVLIPGELDLAIKALLP